ncbi:LAFE_0D02454g1_1 [Lachancea fermentati]|uniref:LAFE_0D02454g1_1 n=1 Tax=Lachancea fermentati TaxID=4955 RepID=A0A1G4MB03_LACFM|nr:LAFE_0D02454g1_1 [Lachancea fermentati]
MFKIKIRSPSSFGAGGFENFEESWKKLESAIELIYEGKASKLSFEELYGTVYRTVLRKNSSELYDRVKSAIHLRLCDIRENELKISKGAYLSKLYEVWQDQCDCLRMISDVMMYLDKVYCKESRKPFVYDMGLELFRDDVMKPLSSLTHEMIARDINEGRRCHTSVDFDLLRELIGMMETLVDTDDSYYLTEFEPYLLKESAKYFGIFVQSHSLAPKDYINEVQRLLENERNIHTKFLNSDTSVKVLNVAKNVLITQNMHFIVDESLPVILDSHDLDSLKLLFGLCKEPGDQNNLLKQLRQIIVAEGLSIEEDVTQKKKAMVAVKWISEIIALKQKYDNILKDIGADNIRNTKSVSEAFSTFLNQRGKKSAENLALYIDFTLRSCKQLEPSTKTSLDHCVTLFKLLRDKDIFEKLYKQQLSKRLLQRRSSLDIEKEIIARMKEEVGIAYTSKMEGMFRDIIISQGYNVKFVQQEKLPFDYEVDVLTTTCWPFQNTSSPQDIVIPPKLERLRLDFENFYIKSHSGRTLKWAYHLGSMDIGFQFARTYHVLSMPVYAAIIFMLFENYNELTMQEIRDLTHIPEQELSRQLISMAVAPKTRILKKFPANKIIHASDKFCINESFTAPTLKVKVLTVMAKAEPNPQSYGDYAVAMKEVSDERTQLLEATIVSTLKPVKTMTHKSLFEKVRQRLSGRFDMPEEIFKDRLQYLIEKEYVQRDPDDPSVYHYLP